MKTETRAASIRYTSGMRTTAPLLVTVALLSSCGGSDGGGGGDARAPSPATAFGVAQGDAQLTLSWTNPSFPGFAGVEIRRSTSAAPASHTEGTQVFSGNAGLFVDTGLANSHFGAPGSFNGAASYIPEATRSGLVFSQAIAVAPLEFQLYASRRNPLIASVGAVSSGISADS